MYRIIMLLYKQYTKLLSITLPTAPRTIVASEHP